MSKVLSVHALAYGLDSAPIIVAAYGEVMSLLMGALYLMHMPWIVLLLLLHIWSIYIFSLMQCIHVMLLCWACIYDSAHMYRCKIHVLVLFHVLGMYRREHHCVQL